MRLHATLDKECLRSCFLTSLNDKTVPSLDSREITSKFAAYM